VLNLLFVYGTLRSEFDNRYTRLLRADARLCGRAVVRGSIYFLNRAQRTCGLRAPVRHCPEFRPQPAGEVHGELYRLVRPASTLRALDEYEGKDFERVMTRVASPVATAWIYQYRKTPLGQALIQSGDFCAP
jgi:gamma-glutamylcyclotransferase (GGCT)/AIG2-like uncharacterized protein YtfP